MGRKKQRGFYSTDPNYRLPEESDQEDYLDRSEQKVKVIPERKGRGGKTVTLIRGLQVSELELATLAKTLKQLCGVGGSSKHGEILIQGDHVDRIVEKLKQEGFANAKRAGG